MRKLFLFALISLSLQCHAQIITTVAGIDTLGYNGDNMLAISASLYTPSGVAVDEIGNIYIADTYNERIRKIDTVGIITTIAGTGSYGYNGDGIPATNAKLYFPVGIICDNLGNIYFADAYNNRVRKISTAGIITTIAGNGDTAFNGDNITADSATVYDPHAVAFDALGNMYISDWGHHRIRKINTSGVITTIAGTGVAGYTGDDGPAITAEINGPYYIITDNIGNVYFADAYANVVRKINVSGIITTFAGNGLIGYPDGDGGTADSARLSNPIGLAIDGSNNIYIADAYHSRIRMVSGSNNIITTVVGNGTPGFSGDNGPAINAEINIPTGMALSSDGTLYIADYNNNRIRRVGWPLGIGPLNNGTFDVALYPSPNNGEFIVNISSAINEQMHITITNALGQKINEDVVPTNTTSSIRLNQPSGIYYLSVMNTNAVISKMFTIIK